MAEEIVVRTITLTQDGVSLEYVRPEKDVKANGVQQNHVLFVPLGDEYDDEIDNLTEAAVYLVTDVLEDLPMLRSMAAALAEGKRQRPDEEDED
jgi:hypothetical protein